MNSVPKSLLREEPYQRTRTRQTRFATLVFAAVAAVLVVGCATPEQEATMPDTIDDAEVSSVFEGGWVGTIDLGATKLRFAVSITKSAGQYQASLDSPDQNAFDIPVDSVEETETGLTVRSSTVAGVLEMQTPVDDGQTILAETVWKQSGQEFPMTMERRDLPLVWTRPQDPVGPLPYSEEEVRFAGAPGVQLAGTLTQPNPQTFPGTRPLVILVSGSGPQDRNEALAGHKPFLVLADHLTRRGLAVLRYDDRGTAASTGNFADAVLGDFAQDAAGAFRFAESRGFSKIGYIGHSEGGYILGKIFKELGRAPAFLVSLAGPAVSGRDVLLAQNEAIVLSQGHPQAVADQATTLNQAIYQTVLDTPDNDQAREKLAQTYRSLGLPEAQSRQQIETLISPWFRDFLAYDPAQDLRALASRAPILAVFGGLDVQVLAEQNAPAFQRILDEAQVPGSEVRVFEGRNHLFQPAVSGALEEYGSIETTIDPEVLDYLASWILSQVAADTE